MEATVIINILLTTLLVSVFGFLNSLLSYLLEYCLYPNSIFGWWLPLSAKINLKIFDPKFLRSIKPMIFTKEYDQILIDNAQNMFFYKVTGGCIICSNIWLGFLTFSLIHYFSGLHLFYLIPYLLISSFLLRKII